MVVLAHVMGRGDPPFSPMVGRGQPWLYTVTITPKKGANDDSFQSRRFGGGVPGHLAVRGRMMYSDSSQSPMPDAIPCPAIPYVTWVADSSAPTTAPPASVPSPTPPLVAPEGQHEPPPNESGSAVITDTQLRTLIVLLRAHAPAAGCVGLTVVSRDDPHRTRWFRHQFTHGEGNDGSDSSEIRRAARRILGELCRLRCDSCLVTVYFAQRRVVRIQFNWWDQREGRIFARSYELPIQRSDQPLPCEEPPDRLWDKRRRRFDNMRRGKETKSERS